MNELNQELIDYNITEATLNELAERHKGISAHDNYEVAKLAAKECQQLRKVLEEARVEKKRDALQYGKRLDNEAKRIRLRIEEVENPIKVTIKEIDDAAAIKEQERIDRIQARIKVIRDYGLELESLEVVDLQTIQERLNSVELDSSFEEFLIDAEGAKAESESRLRIAINRAMAREEEEARLEIQRKDQEAEQKRLDEQQEKIDKQKAEADERDRKAQATEDERKRNELAERDRKLVEEKRKLDRQRLDQEEKERKEREVKAKAEADKLAAEQAPDVDKLLILATDLTAIPMPTMKSRKGSNVIAHVEDSLNDIVNTIRKHAGEMQ